MKKRTFLTRNQTIQEVIKHVRFLNVLFFNLVSLALQNKYVKHLKIF
jgi:hypothetical protein